MPGPQPTVDELTVADPPERWLAAGFRVEGGRCEVGAVRIRLAGPGPERGIVAWAVRDLGSSALDGLPTTRSERPPPAAAEPHPNGALALDHLVAMSPALDRTVERLREAGFDLRRLREGETPGGSTRQAFFRMGEVILEVVEAPEGTSIRSDPNGPARLWGLAFVVDDIEATAAALGPLLGTPRPAVQPSRSIATLRREARLGPAVAFMTPGPGAA
jgi:hypothetical protein